MLSPQTNPPVRGQVAQDQRPLPEGLAHGHALDAVRFDDDDVQVAVQVEIAEGGRGTPARIVDAALGPGRPGCGLAEDRAFIGRSARGVRGAVPEA